MNKTEDRFTGCILGGAIGDGLGSYYEGMNTHIDVSLDIEFTLTDDTQMTIATCEALTAESTPNPEKIASTFTEWYRKGMITRVGSSTLKALKDLLLGQHWALSGRSGEMSAGNGAAMRIAPIAFYLNPEESKHRTVIRDICRITHKNEEAYVGALAVCLSVYYGFNGKWDSQDELLQLVVHQLPDSNVKDRIKEMSISCNEKSIREIALQYGTSGYVAESVPIALLGASRVNSLGFIEILKQLIACGGDTDTIASMAGQIMGAKTGFQMIPHQFVEKIPNWKDLYDKVARCANQIK